MRIGTEEGYINRYIYTRAKEERGFVFYYYYYYYFGVGVGEQERGFGDAVHLVSFQCIFCIYPHRMS